jgi:hypothetical protein
MMRRLANKPEKFFARKFDPRIDIHPINAMEAVVVGYLSPWFSGICVSIAMMVPRWFGGIVVGACVIYSRVGSVALELEHV